MTSTIVIDPRACCEQHAFRSVVANTTTCGEPFGSCYYEDFVITRNMRKARKLPRQHLVHPRVTSFPSHSVVIRDRRAVQNMHESTDQIEDRAARYAKQGVKQFRPQKSLFSDSKEITKPAVFAQPVTLLELAQSETGRTILRKTYERDR